MTDLDERLRGIDRLTPPDLWEAARSKASATRTSESNVSGPRRITIIVAALTIGLAAVVWVANVIRVDKSPPAVGTPTTINVPDVRGQRADDAAAALIDIGLVPEVTRQASDDVLMGVVIDTDPTAGTVVDLGSLVTVVVSDGAVSSQQLPGVDAYQVCRLMVIPGNFGTAGDEVAVFEEERVPGAGCSGSEGFQHVAVLRDGRVTTLSRRITDIFGDQAWRVWPYATPDLNGDGVDEIAVALSGIPGETVRLWFLMLGPDGSAIEGIFESQGSDPFTHLIGAGTDPVGYLPEGTYGMFCEGEGDARRIVTWGATADDPSRVDEKLWRLVPFEVELESNASVLARTASEYPDSGDQHLCGSSVSHRTVYSGRALA